MVIDRKDTIKLGETKLLLWAEVHISLTHGLYHTRLLLELRSNSTDYPRLSQDDGVLRMSHEKVRISIRDKDGIKL